MVILSTKPSVPRKQREAVVIGHAEHQLLLALLRYYCLTSDQLRVVVGYSRGSLRFVQDKLKTLTEAGYCVRPTQRAIGHGGKGLYVFRLGRKGLNYLQAAGEDIPRRFHVGEAQQVSLLYLEHTIAVNTLLINLERLCSQQPDRLTLETMLGERSLKQRSASVTVHEGEARTPVKLTVIPDAWVSVAVTGKGRLRIAFELDRGSEAQSKWRRKVAALVAWWQGPYQELFGARTVVFAVLTTEGEKRRADLQHWTETELEQLGQRAEAERFFFATAPTDAEDPSTVFCAARWLRPFSSQPIGLIADIGGSTV